MKIFSPTKNWEKISDFDSKFCYIYFCPKSIITLFFKKNANFLQKLAKISDQNGEPRFFKKTDFVFAVISTDEFNCRGQASRLGGFQMNREQTKTKENKKPEIKTKANKGNMER
jgi:hypothetical protein